MSPTTPLRWIGALLLAALSACSSGEPPPERPDPAPEAARAAPPDAELPLQIVAGEATIVAEEADAAPPPTAVAEEADASPSPTATPPRRAERSRRPARPTVKREKPREANALATIRAHQGDVEACYARVAFKDPSVAGRVVLRWTLGRDGRPTAVAVTQNTLRDPSVAACIRERARHWQFPPPSGGLAVVTYPFDLRVQ